MPSSLHCLNTDIVPIRPATPADIPQMRQIEQQAAFAAHWTTEQYESLFLPDTPPRIVLVATDESRPSAVLGFLVSLCLPDDWEIESVVVDESVRRQGHASSLIQKLLGRALAAGAAAVIIEVRESNSPARQLYEKIGFIQEYRRKDYYSGPFEHAILYRLTLQSCDKFP